MAETLHELLLPHLDEGKQVNHHSSSSAERYLTRLLSLRLSDLTSTETQSLTQAAHSNSLSIQALSSRSHKSTTASSDQLSTLQTSLPTLKATASLLRDGIKPLDDAAGTFTLTYSRARASESTTADTNNPLQTRKQTLLLSSQSSALQDILELPALLKSSIASASSTSSHSANYTSALDLYAHIKRLHKLYPESRLIAAIQTEADDAMKDMTTSLLNGLKAQNLRLAAAIRTIGWLKRVVPELSSTTIVNIDRISTEKTTSSLASVMPSHSYSNTEEQSEGCFGALFLTARLSTFLSMTIDGLAPLRDLADQETEKRTQLRLQGPVTTQPQFGRRSSAQVSNHSVMGHQTERYLKRYIEVFREQSFSTIQMYRNIFPSNTPLVVRENQNDDILELPSALASFPLHLVSLLMETLQIYLPNITDASMRESILVQVLYAANSLGRLGADFSMMISLLDLPKNGAGVSQVDENNMSADDGEEAATAEEKQIVEPEWYRIIQKHRVQAARLDAMASGREDSTRRANQEVAVK